MIAPLRLEQPFRRCPVGQPPRLRRAPSPPSVAARLLCITAPWFLHNPRRSSPRLVGRSHGLPLLAAPLLCTTAPWALHNPRRFSLRLVERPHRPPLLVALLPCITAPWVPHSARRFSLRLVAASQAAFACGSAARWGSHSWLLAGLPAGWTRWKAGLRAEKPAHASAEVPSVGKRSGTRLTRGGGLSARLAGFSTSLVAMGPRSR